MLPLPSQAPMSRTPDAPWRTELRFDPHWDGLWSRGSDANWFTLEDARHRAAAIARTGSGRMWLPPQVDLSGASARARLERCTDGWWQQALTVLGCVNAYRTVSAQQLGWLLGDESVGSGDRARLLWDLFSLGLIDIGLTASPVDALEFSASARLYRPAKTRAFAELIEPRATFEQWASVTAGIGYESASQYDRHNVLTTELLLRAAEWLPIAAIAGEQQSDLETLAYTSVGGVPPRIAQLQRAADGVLVRPDGVRIAIELTASTGTSFQAKVERWARVLHECRFDDTGLVVVFVTAPRSGRSSSGQRPIQQQVQRTVARTVDAIRGTDTDRTRDRIAVASWESWFPSPGEVSHEFLSLQAARATGADRSNPWVPVRLLDEMAVRTPRSASLRSSIAVLAGLRSQPPHLAAAFTPPELWRVAAVESGLVSVAPKTVNTRTGEPIRSGASGARGAKLFPPQFLPVGQQHR